MEHEGLDVSVALEEEAVDFVGDLFHGGLTVDALRMFAVLVSLPHSDVTGDEEGGERYQQATDYYFSSDSTDAIRWGCRHI